MIEKEFLPSKDVIYENKNGSFSWSSPSNIALVKYWGKEGVQIPKNPSVSFTLSHCKTITEVVFTKKKADNNFSFNVFLDNKKKDTFRPKIQTFFERISLYLPFLKTYHFDIKTQNTFPHSSGIASSASGMSALALCLVRIEEALIGKPYLQSFFYKKASFLSRLGSGSACRSLEGDLVVWGQHKHIENSSDLYGIRYPYTVHENFKNYQDTILLIDVGEKEVSSTVGHNLMHNHPFSKQRFQQAYDNISKIIPTLETGDLDQFVSLVEMEALALHAMMMTSNPYFILMKPKTLEVINKIWNYRKRNQSKLCFTLDAGANVHLLYPESEKNDIHLFIKKDLVKYCKDGQYILDEVGFGAKQL